MKVECDNPVPLIKLSLPEKWTKQEGFDWPQKKGKEKRRERK